MAADLRRQLPPGVDYTESSIEWDATFKRRVLDEVHAQHWRLYPQPQPQLARVQLGQQLKIDPDRIVFTRGADAAIDEAIRIARHQGRRIHIPAPSYPGYDRAAYRHRAQILRYPATLDAEEILERVADDHALAILTWPGNPIGLDLPPVIRPASRLRWLVDATYLSPGSARFAALVSDAGQHADIVFSFSKTYGLASARLGGTIHTEPQLLSERDGFHLDIFQLATANAITSPDTAPLLETRDSNTAAQQVLLRQALHDHQVLYTAATSFVTIDGTAPVLDLHARTFKQAALTRIATCPHNIMTLN